MFEATKLGREVGKDDFKREELELRTDQRSLEECVTDIIDYLHLRDAESAISI